MFFSPTVLKSSAIEKISVDVIAGNAVVKFINNARSYVYSNICNGCMFDFLSGEYTPGEFVNHIKQNEDTTVAVF